MNLFLGDIGIWWLFVLLATATTIWVGLDAAGNSVTTDGKPYSWRNGATAWVIGCVLLWVVFFPLYMHARSKARQPKAVLPPLATGFVTFTCPHCAKTVDAPVTLAGTDGKCPHCLAHVSIPACRRLIPG